MKMKRDTLLPKDLTTFCRTFDDTASAAGLCRMMKRSFKDSEYHVRRGGKTVVKTQFSSNAWGLALLTLLIQFQKHGIEAPEELRQLAAISADHARARRPWFLKDAAGNRLSCADLLSVFRPASGIKPINSRRRCRH